MPSSWGGHHCRMVAVLVVLAVSGTVGSDERLFNKQGHGGPKRHRHWAAGLGYDSPRPVGGRDEKVEGCFSKFDVMETIVLGREQLNNLRCQAACTERGYPLAATSGNGTCFCSNTYPSILSRVDTGRCNHPCSPDRRSCFLFTCCGTADGRLFTVTWSGEIDIMLQLLRRLAVDYRTNSSTFRQRVEGGGDGLCTQTSLRQAGSSLHLGLGSGCPDDWSSWDRACYHVHWGQHASYAEAHEACRSGGGSLVTVTSSAENQFLNDMQGGCQGWLGNAPPQGGNIQQSRRLRLGEAGVSQDRSLLHVGVPPFQNWEEGRGPHHVQISQREPAFQSSASGPAVTDFNEPPLPGVQGLSQFVVRSGVYVDGLRLVYVLANGTTLPGVFWGNATLLESVETVVQLGDDEVVTRIKADVQAASGQLTGLLLRTTRRTAAGAEEEAWYGPFGSGTEAANADSSSVEYRPAGVITGVYGSVSAYAGGRLTRLGFYEWVRDSCSLMRGGSGKWETTPCNSPGVVQAGLCERPGPACSSGWVIAAGTCYRVVRAAKAMTWLEARSRCHALGGYLAALGTREENDAARSLLGPAGGFIGLHKGASEDSPWVWDQFDNTADRLLSSVVPYSPMAPASPPLANLPPKCFEMASSGMWRVVSCTDRPAGSRVVMCERGAPDQACTCSALEAVDGGQQWDGPWIAHGCSCYRQMVTGGGGGRPQLSWLEAQGVCGSVGGRLVSVGSGEENEWVRGSLRSALVLGTGFVPGYLGLNNLADRERFEWTYFQNWRDEADTHGALSPAASTMAGGDHANATEGSKVIWDGGGPSVQGADAQCGQMGRDGKWVRASCSGQTSSCFVCKRERAGPYPNMREGCGSEQWHVDVVSRDDAYNRDGWRGPWCDDCFPAYLRHVSTNQYLCVDAQNLLFMSWARDPAWCLLTLVVHHLTGGMAVVTTHGAALFYDDGDSGQGLHVQMLKGRAAFSPVARQPQDLVNHQPVGDGHKSWQLHVLATPGLAVFTTSCTLAGLAQRYLRLNVISRSKRKNARGPARQCSVAAYDSTPRTDSYRCEVLPVPPDPNDVLALEPRALRIFNDGSYVMPRRPINRARVTCMNMMQRDTANCVLSYGEAMLLLKRFRVQWGYFLFDEIAAIWQLSALQSVLVRYPVPTRPPSACLDSRNTTKRHGKKIDCPAEGAGGNATAGGGAGGGTTTGTIGGLTQGGFPATGNLQTSGGATSVAPGGGGAAAAAVLGGATQRVRTPTASPLTNTLAFPLREQLQLQNTMRIAFNNFYQFSAIRIIIETRTWQFGAQHPPRTTLTIQAFYSAIYLRYRWEVLLQARGAVIITCFGRRIGGGPFSLGDVSSGVDLNFRVFGQYEFPYEATVYLNNRENFFNSYLGVGQEFGIASIGDDVAPVTTFLPSERGDVEETVHGWDFEGKMHTHP